MPSPNVSEHHLAVTRTARYATLGDAGSRPDDVWFVCHGFGQLARYFIRDFTVLAGARRLIVAPEALNRFYLGEVNGATSAQARVGATWMTREDRLTDIADTVAWLDAVYAHIMALLPSAAPRVVVLGFSQGVAAAVRWVARGAVRADRLILWAGRIPDEFDTVERALPLARAPLTCVLGRLDPFATAEVVAAERTRAAVLGLKVEWVDYPGGHAIDPTVLARLAG